MQNNSPQKKPCIKTKQMSPVKWISEVIYEKNNLLLDLTGIHKLIFLNHRENDFSKTLLLTNEPYFSKINKYSFQSAWTNYGAMVPTSWIRCVCQLEGGCWRVYFCSHGPCKEYLTFIEINLCDIVWTISSSYVNALILSLVGLVIF